MQPRFVTSAWLAFVAACATLPPPESQREAASAHMPRSGLERVTIVAMGLE